MRLQYSPQIWPLLASAGVTLTLGIYALRRRRVRGAPAFALTMLAGGLWSLTNALEMAAVGLPAKLFWANVSLFVALVPPAWLAMTLQLTGRERWLTRPRLLGLLAVPLLTVLLAWTNPLHGLVRRDVFLTTAGAYPLIAQTWGPWYWIHTAYSDLLNLSSLLLTAWTLRHPVPLYRRQAWALLAGLGFVVGVNLLYDCGVWPAGWSDPTPAALGLGVLPIAWAIFRYSLFDVMPIARAAIVERMDDAIAVLDLQHRVLDLNPAAERLVRRTAAEAAGLPVGEVLRPWPDLVEACLDPAATDREFAWGGDAQRRHFRIHFSTLSDDRGCPLGRVVVAHDITESKLARRQLIRQQQALTILEERERLARELHDSLGQVLGYVNVQSQVIRDLLARGDASAADEALARLTSVVQEAHTDVREYVREVKATSLMPQGFFRTLRQHLTRFQETYGIAAELLNPGELTDASLDPSVQVQLFRIIQEALTNVRKHSGAKTVRVTFAPAGPRLCVTVEDDGVGFAPAQVSPPESGQSFGLGIMGERAAAAGGRVRVESGPEQGTRIAVEVPLLAREEPPALSPERPETAAFGEGVHPRVLLVDDHPLFLEGLRNLLTAHGVEVVGTATDGEEALIKARHLRPEIILMDIQLPNCDGLTATRLIKAELPETKIVMLTFAEEDADLFEAIKSGASGYLLKNLSADELLGLLAGLARDETPLSPGLARRILAEFARQASEAAAASEGEDGPSPSVTAEPAGRGREELTARQLEVLTLVAQGLTYKEVGAALYLSERTVKYHMGEILARLQLRNRAEVLAYAQRRGLTSPA